MPAVPISPGFVSVEPMMVPVSKTSLAAVLAIPESELNESVRQIVQAHWISC
jgi:hypothetical protein